MVTISMPPAPDVPITVSGIAPQLDPDAGKVIGETKHNKVSPAENPETAVVDDKYLSLVNTNLTPDERRLNENGDGVKHRLGKWWYERGRSYAAYEAVIANSDARSYGSTMASSAYSHAVSYTNSAVSSAESSAKSYTDAEISIGGRFYTVNSPDGTVQVASSFNAATRTTSYGLSVGTEINSIYNSVASEVSSTADSVVSSAKSLSVSEGNSIVSSATSALSSAISSAVSSAASDFASESVIVASINSVNSSQNVSLASLAAKKDSIVASSTNVTVSSTANATGGTTWTIGATAGNAGIPVYNGTQDLGNATSIVYNGVGETQTADFIAEDGSAVLTVPAYTDASTTLTHYNLEITPTSNLIGSIQIPPFPNTADFVRASGVAGTYWWGDIFFNWVETNVSALYMNVWTEIGTVSLQSTNMVGVLQAAGNITTAVATNQVSTQVPLNNQAIDVKTERLFTTNLKAPGLVGIYVANVAGQALSMTPFSSGVTTHISGN